MPKNTLYSYGTFAPAYAANDLHYGVVTEADNLHDLAKQIADIYGNSFPPDKDILRYCDKDNKTFERILSPSRKRIVLEAAREIGDQIMAEIKYSERFCQYSDEDYRTYAI
jgi:hypothetical protein